MNMTSLLKSALPGIPVYGVAASRISPPGAALTRIVNGALFTIPTMTAEKR
jgi:hypothetical protein